MKRLFSSIALILCFLPAGCKSPVSNLSQPVVPSGPPSVPEYIVFAGDTIRFDRPDMIERMDRELIAFTYGQTNSVLMLKRAPKIFPVVEPILKEYGVPDDLKYLMAIESNLDVLAKSKSGAAGLWQFMKPAASEYGLEVSNTVDERYNVEKETRAACRYLLDMYNKFADWMTVAAGYNGGPNGISGKLSTQNEQTAMELYLVEETSRYMFRILAAKMLFANPESFGFDIAEGDKYPFIPEKDVVEVNWPIRSLVDFAKENGVTYAQLRRANPWLRDSTLQNPGGKTYKIVIPNMDKIR